MYGSVLGEFTRPVPLNRPFLNDVCLSDETI
jgi:hypothetical protein